MGGTATLHWRWERGREGARREAGVTVETSVGCMSVCDFGLGCMGERELVVSDKEDGHNRADTYGGCRLERQLRGGNSAILRAVRRYE